MNHQMNHVPIVCNFEFTHTVHISCFCIDCFIEFDGGMMQQGSDDCMIFLKSVARLKEDVLRAELRTGSSPNVSTLLLPQERNNTASQTDLSGEVIVLMTVIDIGRLECS